MSRTYLVIAEHRDGKLRQVALEALQAALLSSSEGDSFTAAILGGEGTAALAEELAGYPVSQIHLLEADGLNAYNPEAYAAALLPLLDAVRPDAVFLGHTAIGRDLAPTLAARLQAGQLSDVVAIERTGDEVSFTRPLYAGKAFEKRSFASFPWVVTVRPNNLPAAAPAENGRRADIVRTDVAAPASLRTVVKEVVRKTSGKVDLSEAKIIVSGGRGVKSADGFKPLEELASLLNGAVGASRGACDAGYCDYGMQIGQTGKVVTPEVYIACGISGAIQHLAGMSGSRVIIAINKDPEAPIFKVADYGIVGDLFEVVPLLTQEFRKALA
ncbi:electron transfer flavoprotein subunit alpha/FixB family protein [Cohnella nanjingensis]|uniref:Electron transfer flavoprotein subunit alpha/FixB family protein n=1 Tax=Cohnella nanjingensis TaxID=1387779 RepID=A0A7X0VDJ6_9BACL|nr:electron transfer flavoprotein subunit alpha/FixB family protein [Cohnella nanjingensis]MBB6669776.1 electron transfer flavoprotein subunit alpha/FixB family protein [Cohnella nanjingensis]